jgi:hypothetical protein
MSELPENTGTIRDEKGRFVPGVSGNPAGKPKDAFSITALVKAELEKLAPGVDKKTHAQRFIDTLFRKAIDDGDVQLIKSIWAYIDGMPKETKEHKGELIINVIHGPKNPARLSTEIISEELSEHEQEEESIGLAS